MRSRCWSPFTPRTADSRASQVPVKRNAQHEPDAKIRRRRLSGLFAPRRPAARELPPSLQAHEAQKHTKNGLQAGCLPPMLHRLLPEAQPLAPPARRALRGSELPLTRCSGPGARGPEPEAAAPAGERRRGGRSPAAPR